MLTKSKIYSLIYHLGLIFLVISISIDIVTRPMNTFTRNISIVALMIYTGLLIYMNSLKELFQILKELLLKLKK